MIRRFIEAQHGATAIEYALIAVLLSIVCYTGFSLSGQNLKAMFQNVANAL